MMVKKEAKKNVTKPVSSLNEEQQKRYDEIQKYYRTKLENLVIYKGMKQTDIAKILDISNPSLSLFFNHNTGLSLQTLIKAADYFGEEIIIAPKR